MTETPKQEGEEVPPAETEAEAAPPPPAEEKPVAPAKEKPGKKAKPPKPNKRAIKAELDRLKASIAERQKQTALLNQQAQELLAGDEQADSEMGAYALEHNELMREFQIAKQEVQDLETILANKNRDIEEIREVSAAELKVYQRKVKHLMSANQHEFSTRHVKNETELYVERQEQQLAAADAERIANALRSDANNLQLENETLMTNHRMKQDRLFTELREEFERQVDARRGAHEQRVVAMRGQLEDKRQRATDEVETRKNNQIKQLQARNAKAFDRIQHYFSGITHNNLDVIKQSKAKISKRKVEMNALRKAVDELNVKRKKLEEPLNALIADNDKLSQEIDVYKQDKRDLARNKAKIRVLEDELRDLQLAEEVLEQRFEQLRQTRDALYDQFETSMHDVRQKTEFRAFVLEQKMRRLQQDLEHKEMQLQEVMQRAEVDSTEVSAKIDDIMAGKNARINELEVELAKVQRAHSDILALYQQKMIKFGIPRDEIGFQTIPTPVAFSPLKEDNG
jgi:DNA repair exonuclease SbcCD ATPase subunit